MNPQVILRRELYPAMERAGIPRVGPTGEKRTFHSLRHTFARIAIDQNRPIFWLSKHLGHSSLDVTSGVYGHFEKTTRQREAEAMAGAFASSAPTARRCQRNQSAHSRCTRSDRRHQVRSTVSKAVQLSILSLALTGFAWQSDAPQTAASAATRNRATANCRAQEVRQSVMRFVAAANGRERSILHNLVAGDSLFQWFTIDDRNSRRSVGFFERRLLLLYLAGRRDGATFKLLSFSFNGRGGAYGHFGYRLAVSSRASRLLYDGKGAVTCEVPPRIAVWSMGNA
jgi:hypothetical protein